VISALPKLSDKHFLVGFFLPVLVVVFAALGLFCPGALLSGSTLLSSDAAKDLPALAFASWTAAVVLMLLNEGLYRLLMGLSGPLKTEARLEAKRVEFRAERDELRRIHAELQEIGRESRSETFPEQGRFVEYATRIYRFHRRFPHEERLVEATRFGNAISAFKSYPLKVYNVDSVAVWPRLLGVMPSGYQTSVKDARSMVDFFVNVLVLLVLLAAACAAALACRPHRGLAGFPWPLAAGIVVAPLLAYGAYEGAIERATAWGDLVRSAFDLYLPALAKQMGYALPGSGRERAAFWGQVNGMILHHRLLEPADWPKAPPGPPKDEKNGSEDEDEG
jgi:hypothetical protein